MSRAVSMRVRQEEIQWTCKERAGEMSSKSTKFKGCNVGAETMTYLEQAPMWIIVPVSV